LCTTFRSFEHPARAAIAAVASLEIARWCGLAESYWAAITTIIIMQSTLGSALTVSVERLSGTAAGAIAGALIATLLPVNPLTFGLGIFLIGILCPLLRLGSAAVRFAGITLAVVILIPHTQSHWAIAVHRFIEVSIGIVVGLAITAAWPVQLPGLNPPVSPSPPQ
jgi:uncharacterized membrane protein YccC